MLIVSFPGFTWTRSHQLTFTSDFIQ